jgi:hypothetical protein
MFRAQTTCKPRLFHAQARLTTAKAIRGAAFQDFDFRSCAAASGFDSHVSACAQPGLALLRVILQRAPAYLFKPARFICRFSSLSLPRLSSYTATKRYNCV